MMQLRTSFSATNRLPLTGSLSLVYVLSLVVTVGTAVASAAGLLFQTAVYPTEELRQSFAANDAVNLIIGVPILLGSMWLARRGRLIGLLFWPGALLYVFYNYTAYIFGQPRGWITFVNVTLVLLSAYIVIDLLRKIDQSSVKTQIVGAVPIKTSGWVLIVYGVMFLALAANLLAEAQRNQVPLPPSDVGVTIADVILSSFLIIGGILLLRRSPLGVASGLGLLFAASALFIGVILVLLLQPVLTNAPFDITGVFVLLIMSLFCFITFALFARGVMSTESQ